MDIRRFRIAAFSIAVLLLVGIGAFVVSDRNALVQQVRVYEVPAPIALSGEAEHGTTGTTGATAIDQQGRVSDNTAAQYSTEYDQGDEDTAAMGESAIDPCCPDEMAPYPAGDIDFGQDTNLDHNPVSPELIVDMKRDAEWYAATQQYEARLDAHYAEGKQLDDEYHSLRPDNPDEFLRNGDVDAFIAKLKVHRAKQDAWWKKLEELEREKPIRPTPTHKH